MRKFKFPPKYKIYDYMMYTGNTILFSGTVFLAGLSLFHIFRYKTKRVPEIEEEVRLFKEAQLMKEQVERESMLMMNKQSKS